MKKLESLRSFECDLNAIEKELVKGGTQTGSFSLGGSNYTYNGDQTAGVVATGGINVSIPGGQLGVSYSRDVYGRDFSGTFCADGTCVVCNGVPW